MAGQGRSVESWNALAPSTRRRWIAAFGSPDAALEAYRNGQSLTKAQRGHAATPERPIRALTKPFLYPRYVATNQDKLNQLARDRGRAQHGTGTRGPAAESIQGYQGPYTWVEPPGTLDDIAGWRQSYFFRDRDYVGYAAEEGITAHEGALRAAQSFARISGAP